MLHRFWLRAALLLDKVVPVYVLHTKAETPLPSVVLPLVASALSLKADGFALTGSSLFYINDEFQEVYIKQERQQEELPARDELLQPQLHRFPQLQEILRRGVHHLRKIGRLRYSWSSCTSLNSTLPLC